MKKDKKPRGEWFIDLGGSATCSKCNFRYCICKERRDGTWPNDIPAQRITKNEEK